MKTIRNHLGLAFDDPADFPGIGKVEGQLDLLRGPHAGGIGHEDILGDEKLQPRRGEQPGGSIRRFKINRLFIPLMQLDVRMDMEQQQFIQMING